MKVYNHKSTKIDVNNKNYDGSELENQQIRILNRTGNDLDILYKDKIIKASIKSFDILNKNALINVNGFDFRVKINEPIDQLINELGFLEAHKHSVKEIQSPMPGLVVKVFVELGQSVCEGENLLSLEAMKMENIIKSPGDGTVKNIKVNAGQAVDKGQILIEFE